MGRKIERHIVTLGGGGFSMERTPLLDDYVLRLTGKKRPRICFLGTASGDSDRYFRKFLRAFPPRRADASILKLFVRDGTDPYAHLLKQDVIYVGGGNTANMLAIWRIHGVDRALRDAWNRGIVLAGISAGMLCWYECCVTDSFGPLAELHDGLGFLTGSACPHYDGEISRRPTYHRLVKSGVLPAGHAADDSAAIHWVGTSLHKCIASRKHARCYRVEKAGLKVVETELTCEFLGR